MFILFSIRTQEPIIRGNNYIILYNQEEENQVDYDTIHIERATTYNAVASQCDNDPLSTADGTYIDLQKLKEQEIRYVALSRDLIYDTLRQNLFSNEEHWRGYFEFGDTIEIHSENHPQLNGYWEVHDCMNARYSNSIDFLFDPSNNKPKLGIGKDIKIIYKND